MKKYLTYFAVILITATTFAACAKSRLVNTNWEHTNTDATFGINFTSKTEFNAYEIIGGQKQAHLLGTYTYDGKRSGKFKFTLDGANQEEAFTVQGNNLSTKLDFSTETIYTKK